MADFSHLELSELYDALALFTKVYTRILSLNKPPAEDLLFNKGIIEQLQGEIQARQMSIVPESEGQLRIVNDSQGFFGDTPALA